MVLKFLNSFNFLVLSHFDHIYIKKHGLLKSFISDTFFFVFHFWKEVYFKMKNLLPSNPCHAELRCHTHFQFSANQITRIRLLI